MPAVYGALCTYRRPGELAIMLDRLDQQTRALDHLIVVDNADDHAVIDLVGNHPIAKRMSLEVLGAPDNPGPAGAFAMAHKHLDATADFDDLFITFDDDDPPSSSSLIEELCAFAETELADGTVAGVGLRGGMLNERTGIIAPRPSLLSTGSGPESEIADHLHGNWFPCYRFGALQRVAGFDKGLFWGFEELDVGRRLKANGYSLRVASALYRSVAPERGDSQLLGPLPARSWRHFYRHRNLIQILRRDRAYGALAVTIVARLILKPVLRSVTTPRLAAWHLRTNLEAIRDGFSQRPDPKHPRHLPS